MVKWYCHDFQFDMTKKRIWLLLDRWRQDPPTRQREPIARKFARDDRRWSLIKPNQLPLNPRFEFESNLVRKQTFPKLVRRSNVVVPFKNPSQPKIASISIFTVASRKEDWCQPPRKRRYRNFRMLSTPTFPPVFLAKYRITATTRKWEKDSQQKFLVSCTLLERIIYIIYTGDWKYYSLNDTKRTRDKFAILSPKNYSHYWTIYIYIYISHWCLTTIIQLLPLKRKIIHIKIILKLQLFKINILLIYIPHWYTF